MEVTLSALLEGKATTIKEQTFLETKCYVNSFINEVLKFTDKLIINVETPQQFTLTNQVSDLTFNKVWIQAILPNEVENYNESLGFIYSLDVKNPIYKIYRAYVNKDNGNLCVFDPSWINVYKLIPNQEIKCSIKELLEKESNFARKLKTIKNTFISTNTEDLNKLLGSLINKSILYELKNDGGKSKLSPPDIIKAYIDVFNNKTSKFYVNSSVEGSVHNLYSSICNQITNSKDITNRFEKTILVGTLFDIIKYESN